MSRDDAISTGEMARLACIMEVCAPKAGNVHPLACFEDVTHHQFIAGAAAIAPILNRAPSQTVGKTIHDCVVATQEAAGSNTNLGIILLLAPLCAAPPDQPLGEGVNCVLDALTIDDAVKCYEAIRLAKPGGLGGAKEADVRRTPRVTLKQAMALAADRDAVARQYANGFQDVIGTVARDLTDEALMNNLSPSDRIVLAHLRQMAREPDSLIRRKCGDEVAQESSRRAQAALDAGWPVAEKSATMFASLDAWLRGDKHRRNPGTSADMIAAGLFVAMRRKQWRPDFRWLAEWVT